ncbi:unnamed protein product [Lampetra planeri]
MALEGARGTNDERRRSARSLIPINPRRLGAPQSLGSPRGSGERTVGLSRRLNLAPRRDRSALQQNARLDKSEQRPAPTILRGAGRGAWEEGDAAGGGGRESRAGRAEMRMASTTTQRMATAAARAARAVIPSIPETSGDEETRSVRSRRTHGSESNHVDGPRGRHHHHRHRARASAWSGGGGKRGGSAKSHAVAAAAVAVAARSALGEGRWPCGHGGRPPASSPARPLGPTTRAERPY